jgi:hypothetical protein
VAARNASVYVWREGPSFGLFVATDVSGGGVAAGRYWLSASSDGVRWSATLREGPHNSPGPAKLVRYRAPSHLPLDLSLLLAWAREAVRQPGAIYSEDAAAVLGLQAVAVREPAVPLALVTYRGFEKIRKSSAHTLAQVHGQVEAALREVREAWGWTPTALEVGFHDSERLRGLAYDPGSEASRALCRISLGRQLVRDYDLRSVWRVLVHELCHHYREEAWPRARTRSTSSHDARFCDALAKVDPVVSADPNACRFFVDEETPAAVEKKREQRAKKESKIVWAPNAGTVLVYALKSGQLRLEWKPAEGLKWKHVTAVDDGLLLEWAQRFAPSDWGRVTVWAESRLYPEASRRPTTFAQLLDDFAARYGRKMPKTLAYLAEARRAA